MNPWLLLILSCLVIAFLVEVIVDILNLRHLSTTVPQEFTDVIDTAQYKRSQEYLKDNTYLQFVSSAINVAAIIAFIIFGGFEMVDAIARSFLLPSWMTGLIFAGLIVAAFWMLQLPFSLFHTFVIEERYGFNRTTGLTFFLDLCKGILLTVVIGGAVFVGIVWFFESFGDNAWWLCWLALALLQLFLTAIAPVVILPLFNRFTPLEEGALSNAIEEYARSQGLELQGIFVMDGSRRSAKTNAFFTGWGRWKRIVLFDTLIEKHSVDEIIAVLAHEVGHRKKRHVIKMIQLSILSMGIKLYVLSLLINNRLLFDAFGMTHLSVYASLFFFAILYFPVDMVLSVGINALFRRYEFQADLFAATTSQPQSMINVLKKLAVENLSNLTPHPWKVIVEDSHPPVVERIRAIRARP